MIGQDFVLKRLETVLVLRLADKKDENDAIVLSMMGRDAFKELSVDYIELQTLIVEYGKHLRA